MGLWVVKILVIRNCDGILTDILLITPLASEGHGAFDLIVNSSSSICFDS